MDDNQQQSLEGQQQDGNTLAGNSQNVNANQQAQGNQNPLEMQQQSAGSQPQNPAAEGNVTYDFSKVEMPEGYELNDEDGKLFIDVIKDMGLSNEQAGSIVKFGAEYGKRLVDGVVKEYEDTVRGWGETAKQELGADFDKQVALAVTARDKFPGLREALDESGAGNRVEVIRALAKLGELLSSDPGMVKAEGSNVSGVNPMNNAKVLYPNTDFSRYR